MYRNFCYSEDFETCIPRNYVKEIIENNSLIIIQAIIENSALSTLICNLVENIKKLDINIDDINFMYRGEYVNFLIGRVTEEMSDN